MIFVDGQEFEDSDESDEDGQNRFYDEEAWRRIA